MRLSQILGQPVVDEHGHELGVVHDVAATQDGPVLGGFGAALRVDALVVGTSGFWDRIGFSPAHIAGPGLLRMVARIAGRTDEIPWERVVDIGEQRIVVRAAPER
jgi:sporulation protein YlmC with PRC-barrel domain